MALVIKKKSATKKPVEESTLVSPDSLPAKTVPVLPDPVFPLVTLREGVVFPHAESVLVFGRPQSQQAIREAENANQLIVVVAQKNPRQENPPPRQLFRIATLAKIERTLEHENELHVLLRGLKRVKIVDFPQTEPFLLVKVSDLSEKLETTDEFQAQVNHLTNLFKKTIQQGKPVEFFNFIKLMGGVPPSELVDHVASTLDLPTLDKQALLEELDINQRIGRVIAHLSREQHILDIEQKINSETKKNIDQRMRENILRERMQAIQKELGELDDETAELDELTTQLAKISLPKDVQIKVEKELRRLSQMSPMHSEYAYIHTWLETVLGLPWSKRSRGRTSLQKANLVLQKHHYGLDKVKERILEHLAVLQLRQSAAKENHTAAPGKKYRQPDSLTTILCFVGPPGVGKTSIGRSIAEALGREFVKVSLGGIHDEAEIRGHRRTYVGALPGRIIQGITQAKTKNPVFMLDEIDKIGQDFRGDPSAALLEALDPEQNHDFSDHYLGLPFDLSEVIFITTANVLHTIPPALRDRLEVVEYAGYTEDEKWHIAKKYLLPQVQSGAGLKAGQLKVGDAALREVIRHYTREAGVRNLKRELASLARKAARQITSAKSNHTKVVITRTNLTKLLGPPKFIDMIQEKQAEIGLVNGLAWTSAGGELLPIEAALTPGKEGITLTGQLGEVMQESAKAAFTYVRSKAAELKIDPNKILKHHVHVHAPEGAVPKDGPSAGVAMTTVLASVYTDRPIRSDIAMTGEVTLRGRVLPIGGLKEKLIAAHRAGIKIVFIPKQNIKDLVELPDKIKMDIDIRPVNHVSEVLAVALLN